ncbi:MAG: GntR domain protein [Solirubrobacterales bacterium]|nr:GntR domain protein [Solirubrobacterales bacterium]
MFCSRTRYSADYMSVTFGRRTVLSAPQQICASIEALVLDGTLRPGDRLPRVDLMAERFGVSAPTAHRALRSLREAGVLAATRGRNGGYRVTSAALDAIDAGGEEWLAVPTSVGYAQLLEVREVQDVLTARAAAAKRTEADIDALEAVLPSTLPADPEVAFALDLRFHRSLAQCTHNPVIVGFTGATALALRRFPRSSELAPAEIVAELDGVASAIRRRDGNAAAQAMRRHLRRSADFFDRASLPPLDA